MTIFPAMDEVRKSFTEVGKIYFWTATINSWKPLLIDDRYKQIVIDSLRFLSDKDLIKVFGFSIMPNHVHLIWKMNQLNGKERPFGSFLKFTAHEFKKILPLDQLSAFKVDRTNKDYEFWQRDPLAFELYSPQVAYQKLEYIHQNPLAKDWNLADSPEIYLYSSASFYEQGSVEFPFLQHIGGEF